MAAADARAAVVGGKRVQRYAGPGTVPVLLIAFAAAPREANSLEVRADPAARTWRLRDAGATLDAASECRPHSPQEVVCPMPAGARVAEFRIALGDGDERAGLDVAAGLPATGYVHGGEGDDVATAVGPFSLSGDTGNDVLTAMFTEGGPGDDALTIAGGRDGAADGGPGTDRVTGGPTNDVLEGGSGIDAVWEPAATTRSATGTSSPSIATGSTAAPATTRSPGDRTPSPSTSTSPRPGRKVRPRARTTSRASRRLPVASATTACAATTARTSCPAGRAMTGWPAPVAATGCSGRAGATGSRAAPGATSSTATTAATGSTAAAEPTRCARQRTSSPTASPVTGRTMALPTNMIGCTDAARRSCACPASCSRTTRRAVAGACACTSRAWTATPTATGAPGCEPGSAGAGSGSAACASAAPAGRRARTAPARG